MKTSHVSFVMTMVFLSPLAVLAQNINPMPIMPPPSKPCPVGTVPITIIKAKVASDYAALQKAVNATPPNSAQITADEKTYTADTAALNAAYQSGGSQCVWQKDPHAPPYPPIPAPSPSSSSGNHKSSGSGSSKTPVGPNPTWGG